MKFRQFLPTPLRRFIYCCTFVVLGSRALASDARFDPADDHLIPVRYRFDHSYERLVGNRLFVTRANLGRITVLPGHATDGEATIALYSSDKDSDATMLTMTRADRNLWSSTFGQDPRFTKAPSPRVTRCDAPFPKETAARVSNAIKKAVVQTRELNNQNNVVTIDSTDVVFSIEARDGRRSHGLLTAYAAGKNGAAMRRLTELLQRYCETTPAQRLELLKRIEKQAARVGN